MENDVKNLEVENKPVTIAGVIKRITFHNPLNGYGIINVQLIGNKDKNKDVTITVINVLDLYEGVSMEFTGNWSLHPKYGKQFTATHAYQIPPETKEGIVGYLSSGFFPGIGPATAKKIVNYFGDDVFEILKNNINRVFEIKDVNKKKLKVLVESWEENYEMNNIIPFLAQHMVTDGFAHKIYKVYKNETIPKIKENPYQLSYDISGIGFMFCDKLAMNLGIEKESEERIKAAIFHVLSHNQNDGHCYLTERQIKGRVKKLINLDISEKVSNVLFSEDMRKKIISIISERESGNAEKRFYSKDIFYAEKYVSEKIVRLSKKEYVNDKENLRKELEIIISKSDIKLSEEQFDSVIGVASNGLSILTGGPGVGKSTTVKFVYELLKKIGKKVLLAAPTGRASQRLMEIIGEEAKTIHRLLKYNPSISNFDKNEMNPLECDFIILDESSMIDIKLASSFFKAVDSKTQVLLVGDKNQLPSVGPGNFLSDLISSQCISFFSLEKVFRQAEKSKIISSAHSINKGFKPSIQNPIEAPQIWSDGTDCMFIESSMDKNDRSNPVSTTRYGMDTVDMIVKLYCEIIPKYLGKENEIQILTPMNKGAVGTIEINKRIQESINPKVDNKKEIIINQDKLFREGDRVIQTTNNYDLNVFNGDIGYISQIDVKELKMIVDFGNKEVSKLVTYNKQDIKDLQLAYSITIHKSQGSEFSTVIMPILNQHYIMLFRNLIYTGLTRAKKMGIIIGETSAFGKSIQNINPNIRQTSLSNFIYDNYNNIQKELEFLD
jgi:exodeoxyribonuclease V alpha subunit